MATVAGAKRLLDISGNNISTAVSLEAEGTLLDSGGLAGSAGQVLSSTSTGVSWINNDTGDITGVTAGTGMTGGGTSGTVTLNVIGGSGITANANDIAVDTTVVRTTTNQSIAGIKSFSGKIGADGGIDGLTNANGGITGDNYNISGVNQLTINDPGEGIVFTGTTNVTLFTIDDTTDSILKITNASALQVNAKITNLSNPTSAGDGANKAYVDSAVAGVPQGDITGVTAGTGMTGGGTSGAVTLNVIGGTGITANANDIAIDATVVTLTGSQALTNKTGSNSQWTNDAGYTTNTGTTTPSSTETFTNKSGSNSQWTNDAGYTTNTGDITSVAAGTGLTGGGTSGAVTLNADTSELAHIVDSSNGNVNAGWITVAQANTARRAGEIYVTDGESSDHSYIRIEWMRSYADSNFTVINCGGHANRIQGVRVLQEAADATYGPKYLQVKVTAASNYSVIITAPGTIPNYSDFTAVTPVLENTKTGYSVTGAQLEDLHNSSVGTDEGITVGGDLFVNGGDIVLGGTGRIQGVDTITDATDAANKAYVDAAVAGVPQGDITAVTAGAGLTGGGTSGAVTLNVVGGTGITANANDIAIDATVATLAGTQTFTGAKTINTLKIGTANKIQFANNDFIRYDDANGVGRFHFDSDGGTNNASVQAATFVGALTGTATNATQASKIKAGGTGPNAEDLNSVANSVSVGQLEYRGYNLASTNKPPASDNANGVITVGQHSGNYNAQVAFSSDGNMYWRDNPSTSNGSWRKMWDAGNDGTGSGLDADKLDGQQGTYYYAASNPSGYTTNTGTTTADNTQTFTNKSGSNSQWTNDAGYTTNAGDITSVVAGTNLNGGGTSGAVTLNLDTNISLDEVNIGSGIELRESADRADLLQITSATSTWAGLQIRNSSNEGRWSFMTDGGNSGFYDDENNEWALLMNENAQVQLYHNGSIKFKTNSTGVDVLGSININDNIAHGGDSNTYIGFPSNDTWRVVTAGSERLRVNSSGNVGIGNTNPGYPLVVNGVAAANRFYIPNVSSTSAWALQARNSANTADSGLYFENGDAQLLLRDDGNNLNVRINSDTHSYINGGSLGLGTTSPDLKLDVISGTNNGIRISATDTTSNWRDINIRSYVSQAQANALPSGSAIYTTNPTSQSETAFSKYGGLVLQGRNDGNSSFAIRLGNGNGYATRMYMGATGATVFSNTVTATNFINSSDERLKENIKEVSGDKVEVNWKTFEFKTHKGHKRYGVIAQELEENHPEFVQTDNEGMKSVAYTDLLIAKIAELESRIQTLENN